MTKHPYLVALAIAIQARVATLLWGESGIGKTAVLTALVDAIQDRLWVITLSVREPTDQGGMPRITDEGFSLVPPQWCVELRKEGGGVVFFDELNTAPPAVQASALRIINERQAGETELPEDTAFVAASNPPGSYPGTFRLPPSMANRWCHIQWPVDHTTWCDGMISGFPTPDVPKLNPEWTRGIGVARSNVSAYIRANASALHNRPDDPEAAGQAWPSPRTWTVAARLMAAAQSAGYGPRSEVAQILVDGCVGEAAGRGFRSWLVKLDLRDPEEYLADPSTPMPKRQDQIKATLDSIVAAALSTSKTAKQRSKRCAVAWEIIGRMAPKHGDLVVVAARVLAVNMPADVANKIPESAAEVYAILEAAKIDYRK